MGILKEPLDFILTLPLPSKFHVCELGDQWITHEKRRLAKEFYEQDMGCGRYESIDGNGRGTILADLNYPIRPWPGEFDLVTDFGTGEHVFNQCQVFQTIHLLTRPGGYIVFDRPTDGYQGHCYWNAQECVYEDLAVANNYEVLALDRHNTVRGSLVRGVFRRVAKGKFRVPYQGRYKKLLRPIIDPALHARAEAKRLRLKERV